MPAFFDKMLRAGEGKILRKLTGIAAQVNALEDDFVLAPHGRIVHVLNAPSPAATASLAIGGRIADAVAAMRA